MTQSWMVVILLLFTLLLSLWFHNTQMPTEDGKLLTGKAPAASADKSFRSQAELVQAMNDPRYDMDEAYRADVMAKLENSNLQF